MIVEMKLYGDYMVTLGIDASTVDSKEFNNQLLDEVLRTRNKGHTITVFDRNVLMQNLVTSRNK